MQCNAMQCIASVNRRRDRKTDWVRAQPTADAIYSVRRGGAAQCAPNCNRWPRQVAGAFSSAVVRSGTTPALAAGRWISAAMMVHAVRHGLALVCSRPVLRCAARMDTTGSARIRCTKKRCVALLRCLSAQAAMEWVFAHMADPDFEQPIVAPPIAGAHHCGTQLSAAALRHFDRRYSDRHSRQLAAGKQNSRINRNGRVTQPCRPIDHQRLVPTICSNG
jgi:hypothetical protein